MSARSPLRIVDISDYSPELDRLLRECFLAYNEKLRTRLTANSWERETIEKILESNPISRIGSIYNWLIASTGLPARVLPLPIALRYFVETQKLRHHGMCESAVELLQGAQEEIDQFLFGTNGVQHHQHNIREDLTEGIESEGDDDNNDDDDLEEDEGVGGDGDGGEGNDNRGDHSPFEIEQPSSATNSPKRKRARTAKSYPLPIEYTNLTSQISSNQISFEQFDQLPIRARSKSVWNQLLKANPKFWRMKCDQWSFQLKEAFQAKDDINATIDHLKVVIDVLRQLRQIQQSIYGTNQWRSVVKVSGLAAVIAKWSDPRGLLWKAHFVKLLIRRHKILVTLNLVLLSWTPSSQIQSWGPGELAIEYSDQGLKIKDSQQLFQALKKYPDVIPREAYPSSVFFLLSLQNFELALKEWIIYALESKGYATTIFGQSKDVEKVYRGLKKIIMSLSEAQLEHIRVKDAAFVLILQRTQKFHNYKKKVEDSVLHNRSGIQGKCRTCLGLEPSKQCVQDFDVDIKDFEDADLGCGISLANPEDHMDPLPIPHGKNGPDKLSKPIYHPDHFQLRRCGPKEDIIERCGMLLYRIRDKSTKKVLDFWLYNAFSEEVLKALKDHHSSLQKVKAVKRGQQFNLFSQGSMIPKGSREAMGGVVGDTYTLYAGMEAVSLEDLDSLFNDAEDSMILLQAARLLDFGIFKDIREASSNGDRIGTSAATTYLCNNYTSPIHKDQDKVTGLCAQLELQAKASLCEYSFIHADYRVYFVSRSNSLWSFNGNRAHGTMLPSRRALDHSDCLGGDITGTIAAESDPDRGSSPPRVSNGNHLTVTNRNKVAADKNQEAHSQRQNLQSYWKL